MKHLFLFLFFAVLPLQQVYSEDFSSMYDRLDETLANSQQYVDEHERQIASLKQELRQATDDAQRYKLSMDLFDRYKAYVNDSAVVYIERCRTYASRMHRADLEGLCLCLWAFQCSTVGMYDESREIIKHVSFQSLTHEGRMYYYLAKHHVYHELAYYTNSEELKNYYSHNGEVCLDSLLLYAPKNSTVYFQYTGLRYYYQANYKASLKITQEWLSHVSKNEREYSLVAYFLHLYYFSLNDYDRSRRYLIESSISDIRHAVMDQGSLWTLAEKLGNEGDLDRAYRYIGYSWSVANIFGTRLRSNQIAPILSMIEKSYQDKVRHRNTQLVVVSIVLCLLVLALFGLLVYVNVQRRRLANARNSLSDTNIQLANLNKELKLAFDNLDDSNRRLQASMHEVQLSNAKLNESNQVKEQYIGRFLRLCSQYIDKMEGQRKHVADMISNGKIQDLARESRSTENKEKELTELYASFDDVFVQLFPSFVDELNALLRPEEQLHLSEKGALTTTIRIFALIRLGIDDSAAIADFLHCSIRTIYNYRTKVRNSALHDRDNFEQHVKLLGLAV